MYKVLVFNGSPRKHGNTQILCDYVTKYLNELGIYFDLVTSDCVIHPCMCCGGCQSGNGCIIDDAWKEPLSRFKEYTHFLIMSPIYFFSFTAQTKAFIDRTGCFEWDNKKIGLILCSGSGGFYGGADLVEESIIRNIDCYNHRKGLKSKYCGMYNKVTNDNILPLSRTDVEEINNLIGGMLDVKKSKTKK